jgi:hypothetical protein
MYVLCPLCISPANSYQILLCVTVPQKTGTLYSSWKRHIFLMNQALSGVLTPICKYILGKKRELYAAPRPSGSGTLRATLLQETGISC